MNAAVEIIGTAAVFEEALALRYLVFCDEQGVPREIERDAEDEIALHVVVRDPSGRVQATGRVLRMRTSGALVALTQPGQAGDAARIGRMAVRPDARRSGLGARVLLALEEQAARAGLAEAVLHAQLRAEPFYRALGYARRGPEFEEAGIEHVEMVKALGQS